MVGRAAASALSSSAQRDLSWLQPRTARSQRLCPFGPAELRCISAHWPMWLPLDLCAACDVLASRQIAAAHKYACRPRGTNVQVSFWAVRSGRLTWEAAVPLQALRHDRRAFQSSHCLCVDRPHPPLPDVRARLGRICTRAGLAHCGLCYIVPTAGRSSTGGAGGACRRAHHASARAVADGAEPDLRRAQCRCNSHSWTRPMA